MTCRGLAHRYHVRSVRGDANLQNPHDHLKSCHDYGMKTGGNAAGHLKDPWNLNGSVTKPSTNVPGALFRPLATHGQTQTENACHVRSHHVCRQLID